MRDGDLRHPSPADVAVLPVDPALEKDETASLGVFPEVFGGGKMAGSIAKGQCRLLAHTAASPNLARDRLVSAAPGIMSILQVGRVGTYPAVGKKLSLTAFTAPGHQILSPCMKIFLVKTFSVKSSDQNLCSLGKKCICYSQEQLSLLCSV